MAEKEPDLELDQFADELIAERRTGDGIMPDDMPEWQRKLVHRIDRFSLWTGRIVCWLTVPMIFAMVYEVIARKFFNAPTMWAYDMSRFFYGGLFMLGAGYALSKGVHIRADFIYRNWSARTQGRVDKALYLLFYFPGLLVFLFMATEFATDALLRGEKGTDTAWMPYMGPIKSALPLGVLFLLIQGVSEVIKSSYAAKNNRWPG